MNITQFNKIHYKHDIATSFYLFCLKKDIKLIRFIFINIYYIIISILFNNKKDIYKKKKYNYLKYVKNLNKEITLFSEKVHLNTFFDYHEDIIIEECPKIILSKIIKKKKVIAYDLDKNYDTKLELYENQINKLNNISKVYSREKRLLRKIDSQKKYLVKNNRIKSVNNISFKLTKCISNIIKPLITPLLLILISIMLTFISFFFAITVIDFRFIESYLEVRLFLLNFLPILIIVLLIYILSKRVHISLAISSFLIMLLGIANQTKLIYRDDIVKFEDLFILKEAAMMGTKYSISIRWYAIVFIIFIFILFLLIKRYVNKNKANLFQRIMALVSIIAISIISYNKLYNNTELYNQLGNESLINKWVETRQFQIRGLVYPFVYTIKDSIQTEPEGYDKVKVEKILSQYKYENIPKDKKVNVIAIMLEAYNDFSKYESIDFTEDVYSDFHKIQKKSISGNLVTSIFGGGTIVTERNFLTGYYSFPSYRVNTNSYVWYFKEQGYKTEASHPITGTFYNRRSINMNLGFDNFYYEENRYNKYSEKYYTDGILFDSIIKDYEKAEKEKTPYFHFSVTYQNHGPYTSQSYDRKPYFFDKNSMNHDTYESINTYFRGIRDTNEKLYNFIEYFEEKESPTIIILFGDHNPYLGENALGYNELGINMDVSTEEGFLNYYETPYIIYGNNSAKKVFNKSFVGKGNDISPMFLMNELFDYIELPGNQYLQYTSNLKKEIDVINPYYYKINGQFARTTNNKLVDEYKYVNYYVSRNFDFKK